MSMRSLFTLIGFLLGTVGFSQTIDPPIEEVAANFYNTYDISHQNSYVYFEKRARRWYVNAKTVEGSALVAGKDYLYFDKDSSGYQKLPFDLKPDLQFVDFGKYVDSYQISNFHLHKYYGYEGWYKDVIADLSDEKDLSDSSLYSLARAFSAYASSLLADQGGDALKDEMFKMPMARNCLTNEQREKYRSIITKSIRCFSELNKQNKNFETKVGKIAIKYANEVMVEFHSYLTYADSFAATFPLPDDLYPDSVVEKARRVLKKCPSNAILLSLGDNDFYPILYVQHKMGLRRDVYLINQSLIGLDRFIYMASQPQFQSKPIRLSVNYPQYKENINDYLVVNDGTLAIDFSTIIDTIQRGRRNEYGALSIPGKEFIIKRTSGKTARINDDVIHFKETSSYLLKNDWVLLDILNNLDGRKLCSQTPLNDPLSQLNDYFVKVDDDLYVF